MRIEYHPAIEGELVEIRDYYNEQSRNLGDDGVRAIMFTKLVLPIPGAPEIRSLSGWSGVARRRRAFRISTSATLLACPTKSSAQDGTKQVGGMGVCLRGILSPFPSSKLNEVIRNGLCPFSVNHHRE